MRKATAKSITEDIDTIPVDGTDAEMTSEIVIPAIKKTAPKKMASQIDRQEMIPVRSVCYGNLQYISPRSGMTTMWIDYGALEFIEMGELITMKSSNPKFFSRPLIVIEDENAAEYLGLADTYTMFIDVENLDLFFKKPLKEISTIIKTLPYGMKEAVGLKARDMIRDESLSDLRVIKILESELNYEFLELMK